MSYQWRVIDAELDELLGPLSALALEGAKGVGKTATAERRARTVLRFDEPSQRQLAEASPELILEGQGPVLLDEWQRVPEIWDAVKRAVDRVDTSAGPFLLTGSATPPEGEDRTRRHSGAARIDALRMRPMTLPERLQLRPTVSLRSLLDGAVDIDGETEVGLADYTAEIVRSGFPGIRRLDDRPLRTRIDGYISRVIDHDFKDELGETVRRPDTLRRWMSAYAAATATTTSLEKIRDATYQRQSTPAKTTVLAYRDALVRLFILDPIDGWTPTGSQLKRLAQGPKHHLVDPALAVSLLGLSESKLLSGREGSVAIPGDGAFLGALFESLSTLSVRVFAQAAEARTFHLRSYDGGHEVDLIVEGRSGEIVACEVKLSAAVDDADVKNLRWLKGKIGERLCEAVVITTGSHAYRRKDGICVVPLALLGP